MIIDAGANIGTSAIYFSIRYPNSKIYAIEPEEENYDLLVKNIGNHRNVTPIKAGLWSKEETKTIQNRMTGPWGYTIAETPADTESTRREIKCVTIETLMKEYGFETVDILKIDIEGSEREVLESAAPWIGKVNVILVELHDRICMGCSRAFYLATKDFMNFEKNGEKITAYNKKSVSK